MAESDTYLAYFTAATQILIAYGTISVILVIATAYLTLIFVTAKYLTGPPPLHT